MHLRRFTLGALGHSWLAKLASLAQSVLALAELKRLRCLRLALAAEAEASTNAAKGSIAGLLREAKQASIALAAEGQR